MRLNESSRSATRYAAAVLVVGGATGFLSNHVLMQYRASNDIIAAAERLTETAQTSPGPGDPRLQGPRQ